MWRCGDDECGREGVGGDEDGDVNGTRIGGMCIQVLWRLQKIIDSTCTSRVGVGGDATIRKKY
jgi:hypothetical protein